jgi:hypothetical protein
MRVAKNTHKPTRHLGPWHRAMTLGCRFVPIFAIFPASNHLPARQSTGLIHLTRFFCIITFFLKRNEFPIAFSFISQYNDRKRQWGLSNTGIPSIFRKGVPVAQALETLY